MGSESELGVTFCIPTTDERRCSSREIGYRSEFNQCRCQHQVVAEVIKYDCAGSNHHILKADILNFSYKRAWYSTSSSQGPGEQRSICSVPTGRACEIAMKTCNKRKDWSDRPILPRRSSQPWARSKQKQRSDGSILNIMDYDSPEKTCVVLGMLHWTAAGDVDWGTCVLILLVQGTIKFYKS